MVGHIERESGPDACYNLCCCAPQHHDGCPHVAHQGMNSNDGDHLLNFVYYPSLTFVFSVLLLSSTVLTETDSVHMV